LSSGERMTRQLIVGLCAILLAITALQTTFTVRRATAGQAFTVPLTVVDGCGDWPAFVGRGPA
jgi:hypothetical protein